MLLVDATAAFLHHLRVEKQYSPHTLASYQRDLEQLHQYVQTQSLASVKEMQGFHIRACLSQLHRRGLNKRSLQRWLSACRSFFRFCLRHGWILQDPTTGISGPKPDKPLPKVLDPDQVTQLLRDRPLTFSDCRDLAMLELMYSCGLRLSELTSLNMDAIDLPNAHLRVLGKGKKTRQLPIGRQAIAALKQWYSVRAERTLPNEVAAFVNHHGKRIGARGVQKRFAEMGIKQGVETPLNPHMMRHSFASHLLESSSDLRAVQELLGHANITTTQVYTHLDYQHLAKVYDNAHPRAKRRET